MLALRDLKLLVLDKLGHGQHGARRLGAALRLFAGPAELVPMLKGLDAAELVSLDPPEPGYRVACEGEDAAVVALRAELQALRMTALQLRAESEGLNPGQIDDAVDSAQPRAELIALILARCKPTKHKQDHLYTPRSELAGLRVTALQQRCKCEGIGEAQVRMAINH
jgi:hypothetical protein